MSAAEASAQTLDPSVAEPTAYNIVMTEANRYEKGHAQPVAAVFNLFNLLDRHPDLLEEVMEVQPLVPTRVAFEKGPAGTTVTINKKGPSPKTGARRGAAASAAR